MILRIDLPEAVIPRLRFLARASSSSPELVAAATLGTAVVVTPDQQAAIETHEAAVLAVLVRLHLADNPSERDRTIAESIL